MGPHDLQGTSTSTFIPPVFIYTSNSILKSTSWTTFWRDSSTLLSHNPSFTTAWQSLTFDSFQLIISYFLYYRRPGYWRLLEKNHITVQVGHVVLTFTQASEVIRQFHSQCFPDHFLFSNPHRCYFKYSSLFSKFQPLPPNTHICLSHHPYLLFYFPKKTDPLAEESLCLDPFFPPFLLLQWKRNLAFDLKSVSPHVRKMSFSLTFSKSLIFFNLV